MRIDDPWTRLRELTGARIALGRAGHSLPTRELLAFQLAHARARDAVWCELEANALAEFQQIRMKSAARDRHEYLLRPDLGRRLAAGTKIERGEWDSVIVVADGLSATAVHRHAAELVRELIERLEGWRIAPICVVEQGRVAIGDDIGERIGAEMALVLIGERPGLSSPDSLGAYLTWAPRVGRTDAERNCVSNIKAGTATGVRSDGLEPAVAAVRIAQLMEAARQKQLTGINLCVPIPESRVLDDR